MSGWINNTAGGRCRQRRRGSILERPECLVMKRPGKPDTGNPFVRLDEGVKWHSETDNFGQFNPPVPLRLPYRYVLSIAGDAVDG